MLVIVVLLCMSVELPHGILKILVALRGAHFADNVYSNLGDFIDFLTLLYSAINFGGEPPDHQPTTTIRCRCSSLLRDVPRVPPNLFPPLLRQPSRGSSSNFLQS